jgi:hypothetical protein
MKPKVYLETTIVSFLTARPSRDAAMTGLIEHTKTWWNERRLNYDLAISDVVIREASGGDATAARRRREMLRGLPVIPATLPANELARSFISHLAVPPKAADDALHIAIATVAEINYLLTWNCRHIANAEIRPKLEALCALAGYRCPIICTPLELMGDRT